MRWIAEIVWLVVAVVAYWVYGPFVSFQEIVPVFPIVLVVRVALNHGQLPGNLIGFLCGLLLDLFAFRWLGSSMLVDSIIGYTVGSIREHVVIDSFIVRSAILTAAALAHTLGLVLVRAISGPVGPEPFTIALWSGLYTAGLGILWWVLNATLRSMFGLRGQWHAEE